MCYAKPGPRCSAHASKRLNYASKRYAKAQNSSDEHLIARARWELEEAMLDFHETPAGQERLLHLAKGASTDAEREDLLNQRHRGIERRETKLARYKQQKQEEKAYAAEMDAVKNDANIAMTGKINDVVSRMDSNNAEARQELRDLSQNAAAAYSHLDDDMPEKHIYNHLRVAVNNFDQSPDKARDSLHKAANLSQRLTDSTKADEALMASGTDAKTIRSGRADIERN